MSSRICSTDRNWIANIRQQKTGKDSINGGAPTTLWFHVFTRILVSSEKYTAQLQTGL